MSSMHEEGVSRALINEQLNRLLSSKQFDDAERMKRFLTYLVTETLAGRSSRLKGYNIGVDVFERGDEFDPRVSPIVRVEARRLRRLLDSYYARSNGCYLVRIDIPKGTYVPTFTQPSHSTNSSLASSQQDRCASQDNGTRAAGMPMVPAVAVLSFRNMSVDPRYDVFCDGLVEEVTTRLAQFPMLTVVGRQSAFQFRDQDIDLRQVGIELGAQFLLEGSVRAASHMMRVTVRLVDANSGLHIWAEQYDQEIASGNPIQLQDELARSIAATVAGPHGVITRHDFSKTRTEPTTDPYGLMLRWSEYMRRYDKALRTQLHADSIRVLEDYPSSSLAWTVRGSLALDQVLFDDKARGDMALAPALGPALEHLATAIDLDPMNASAFQSLASTRHMIGDIDGAFEAGEHAIKLNPNDSESLAEHGSFRCLAGDWERGLGFVNQSIALTPMHSPIAFAPLCLDRYRRGDDVGALKYASKLNVPGAHWRNLFRAMALGQLNETAAATAAVSALLQQVPDYATRAAAEFRTLIKDESLADRCLEGLAKAGLDLP